MAMATGVLLGALAFLSSAAHPTAAANPSSNIRTSSIVLTISMTGDCAIDDEALEIAKAEAARVWSSAGVEVRWVSPNELPYTSPRSDWVVAQCIDSQPPRTKTRVPYILPVAAIRFVGSVPTNTIVVSVGSANALLERESGQARDMADRFRALRFLRLGRMLGRAIAHEIGHFLSQSGSHTRSGLMRATHTVTAFTGESLHPFRVDREELARRDYWAARFGLP
jgi:hypothetical protein